MFDAITLAAAKSQPLAPSYLAAREAIIRTVRAEVYARQSQIQTLA